MQRRTIVWGVGLSLVAIAMMAGLVAAAPSHNIGSGLEQVGGVPVAPSVEDLVANMTAHEKLALLAIYGEGFEFDAPEQRAVAPFVDVIAPHRVAGVASEADPQDLPGIVQLPETGVAAAIAPLSVEETVASMSMHERSAVLAIFGDSNLIEFPEQAAVAAYASIIDPNAGPARVAGVAGPELTSAPAIIPAVDPAVVESLLSDMTIHEWHALLAVIEGTTLLRDDPTVAPFVEAIQARAVEPAPSPRVFRSIAPETFIDSLSAEEQLAVLKIYGDGPWHDDPEMRAVAPFADAIAPKRIEPARLLSVEELVSQMPAHEQLAILAIYGDGGDDPEKDAVAPFVDVIAPEQTEPVRVYLTPEELVEAMTMHEKMAILAIYGDGGDDPEKDAVAPFVDVIAGQQIESAVIPMTVEELVEVMTMHERMAILAIYGDGSNDPEKDAVAPFVDVIAPDRIVPIRLLTIEELVERLPAHEQLAILAIFGDGSDTNNPEQMAVQPMAEAIRASFEPIRLLSVEELLETMTVHERSAIRAICGDADNTEFPEQEAVASFVEAMNAADDARAREIAIQALIGSMTKHEMFAVMAICGEGEAEFAEQHAVSPFVEYLMAYLYGD